MTPGLMALIHRGVQAIKIGEIYIPLNRGYVFADLLDRGIQFAWAAASDEYIAPSSQTG
jgi:hypothetical protein